MNSRHEKMNPEVFKEGDSKQNLAAVISGRMKPVDSLMKEAIAGNVFPGAVLHVSGGANVKMFKAYGYANLFANLRMTLDTFFDLASLTKPLATTLAIVKLIQETHLNLDESLSALLPPFRHTDKSRITLRQLLSHDSGLPDYRPYYQALRNQPAKERKKKLREFLLKEPLLHFPGQVVLYSDLGFMILEWVVENLAGRRLDEFVADEIYAPLGLFDLFYVDLESDRRHVRFAATEFCPWRKTLLDGEVHDDNAYITGGIAGHAGLFGTAREVFRLLKSLLAAYYGRDAGSVFQQNLLREIFTRQQNAERALGFDMPAPENSSCGRHLPKTAVGHLGFTGTSFWMDIENEIIIILLSNRIHPSRDNLKIRDFRPILHDTIMECISD